MTRLEMPSILASEAMLVKLWVINWLSFKDLFDFGL